MYTKLIFSLFAFAVLSSCAAGSATAGYAIKSQCADSLTASAEQRIVDRTKREIMADLNMNCPHTAEMR